MLVLSRRVGEEIVIGDNIRVRVLSVQGNQVRLGFIAPRTVQIHREELLQRQPPPAPVSAPAQARPATPLPQPDAVVEPGPDATHA